MIELTFAGGDCSQGDLNLIGDAWLIDAADTAAPLARVTVTTKCGTLAKMKCAGKNGEPFLAVLALSCYFAEDGVAVRAEPDFRCRIKHHESEMDWHAVSPADLTLNIPLLTDAVKTPDGRVLRQGLKVGTIRSQRQP